MRSSTIGQEKPDPINHTQKQLSEQRIVINGVSYQEGTKTSYDNARRVYYERDGTNQLKKNGRIYVSRDITDTGTSLYVLRSIFPTRTAHHEPLYDKYVFLTELGRYVYDYSVALIRIYPLCYHTLPHDLSPLPLPLVIGPEQSGQRRIHLF